MMLILCVGMAIAAIVVGVMIYSIATFPRAPDASDAKFRHGALTEVIWAIVPIAILVGTALPAVKLFLSMERASEVRQLVADSRERP